MMFHIIKYFNSDIYINSKFYFMYYIRVVIILLSTGLYKSAFLTYDFGKTSFSSFCVLYFRVSVSFGFNF